MTEQRYTEGRKPYTGDVEFDKHESTEYYKFFAARSLAVEETERQVSAHATDRTKTRWSGVHKFVEELMPLCVVLVIATALVSLVMYLVHDSTVTTVAHDKALPVQIAACASACAQRGTAMHAFRDTGCECK